VESKFGAGKDTEYNLWCFHPGFSLSSLVKCNIRTLILTSGTLKPMESFQTELSANFTVKLQNDHVIDAVKQINFQVMSQGPDGTDLISTFQSRSNLKYLASIGQALVEIARVVPDGLLVFFPSYAWMDTYLNNWKQVGVWERLNHWKQCFVEPKNRSALAKTVEE
jgi:regulator of telomere elongation helicase 1